MIVILFILIAALSIGVISFFIAKYMVNNNKGLAKKMIIGEDSQEEIDKMFEIAQNIFDTHSISDINTDEYIISVTIYQDIFSRVKIKSKYTEIFLFKDGRKHVSRTAFSKKSAISIIFPEVFVIITLAFSLPFSLIQAFILN